MLAQNQKNFKGYHSEKIINKFNEALNQAKADVKAGIVTSVNISNGNSKMGAVASVSILPFITCPARCAGTCAEKCYAAKLANLRPAVLKNYANNTALAMLKPDLYWSGIKEAVNGVRFFRFHVSGDIINGVYFGNMVSIAFANPHCEILCFTKRYEIVNKWIEENGVLPENLHILFSGWNNLKPVNPFELPETNVFKTENEIRDNWLICGGNCFNCACRGVGCWQAKAGETVAFKLH